MSVPLLPVCDYHGVVCEIRGGRKTYSEDDCADVVVEARSADCLLVCLWCASLLGQDEAGADPNTSGTEHEGRGERLAVEETAGSNDLHGLAGHGRGLALAHGGDGGDEDGSRDVAGVAAALAALGADEVDAEVKAFLDVLGVACMRLDQCVARRVQGGMRSDAPIMFM